MSITRICIPYSNGMVSVIEPCDLSNLNKPVFGRAGFRAHHCANTRPLPPFEVHSRTYDSYGSFIDTIDFYHTLLPAAMLEALVIQFLNSQTQLRKHFDIMIQKKRINN